MSLFRRTVYTTRNQILEYLSTQFSKTVLVTRTQEKHIWFVR